MSDIKFAIVGAAGRMGRTLVRTVHEAQGCVVSGACEYAGADTIGQDAGVLAGVGPLDVLISADPEAAIAEADAVLDFTIPDATVIFAEHAAAHKTVHVIGTTGLSDAQEATIATLAERATIVKAGNMSLGVNLLVALTQRVAKALDAEFDIEVVEMHHRHKIDAPSGTALMLGEAAASGRGVDLASHSVRGRDGETGARPEGHIGFASLRGGSVVGDHTVIFAADGERIELTHKAADRSLFARGAVKAAMWGQGKGPGLYSMADVLGL
jgi:4-hydroxy-tetrahydrodipicolinate reductase